MAERRGLGRGLSALIADAADVSNANLVAQEIPVDRISPNPDQPRRRFNPAALEELAASIRERGVIQPLVLRPDPDGSGRYQIVAGERRWRAAQMAQVHELPAVVRELGDEEVLEIAIIENIQRADLDIMEEASGYRQLMDRFGHTQERLAEALGKSRSHIANTLRLLNLPDPVRTLVADGAISAGHARALLSCDDAVTLAKEVVKRGLNVRQTERLAKTNGKKRKLPTAARSKDADTKALQDDLSAALGMKVGIDHSPTANSGSITIHYETLDDLDRLCQRLSVVAEKGAD